MSKHKLSHQEAVDLAISLVKKAGFELRSVSRSTESCYYSHPARSPLLLRISPHSTKHAPIGITPAIAKVTISHRDLYLTEKNITHKVMWAIGQYFLNDPKPSLYDGPKESFSKELYLAEWCIKFVAYPKPQE